MKSEHQIKKVVVDHGTWAITVESDPTRGKKEEQRGLRKSNFWLFRGVNSSKVYEEDSQNPFVETISDERERNSFRKQLQALVSLYSGHYEVQKFGDTAIVRGTYVSSRRGRASIVVTPTSEKESIYHIWLNDRDIFVQT